MTLILKLDLDMIEMYLHTKNEVSMSSGSKVIAWTDRHTDRHTDTQTDRQTDVTENITYPRTRVVIITSYFLWHLLPWYPRVQQQRFGATQVPPWSQPHGHHARDNRSLQIYLIKKHILFSRNKNLGLNMINYKAWIRWMDQMPQHIECTASTMCFLLTKWIGGMSTISWISLCVQE